MQKTKKAVLKRIKISGSGKYSRRTAGHRHLLRNKSTKQRRSASNDHQVSQGFSKHIKAWVSVGL